LTKTTKEIGLSEPVLLRDIPTETGRKGITGNGAASRVWKGEGMNNSFGGQQRLVMVYSLPPTLLSVSAGGNE
jgi:hypothetical protein